jgi:hypothetical protein
MTYILSNYVAHGFELDFGLVVHDFAFDMTQPIFRDVIISITSIETARARAITVPLIPY